MEQAWNVEQYLRSFYEHLGQNANDIVSVVGLPLGRRLPLSYRVERRDGTMAIVWARYLHSGDTDRIANSLGNFRQLETTKARVSASA